MGWKLKPEIQPCLTGLAISLTWKWSLHRAPEDHLKRNLRGLSWYRLQYKCLSFSSSIKVNCPKDIAHFNEHCCTLGSARLHRVAYTLDIPVIQEETRLFAPALADHLHGQELEEG